LSLLLESEFLSPAFGNGFLKGFDPEEFPDLEARESPELFLVEDAGLFGFPELLSLLILKIYAKIVYLPVS
jgi:hypothetical protein